MTGFIELTHEGELTCYNLQLLAWFFPSARDRTKTSLRFLGCPAIDVDEPYAEVKSRVDACAKEER